MLPFSRLGESRAAGEGDPKIKFHVEKKRKITHLEDNAKGEQGVEDLERAKSALKQRS